MRQARPRRASVALVAAVALASAPGGAVSVQRFPSAGSGALRPCQPPCEHGGLCMQTGGVAESETGSGLRGGVERGLEAATGDFRALIARLRGRAAPAVGWRCFCPAPWLGPTCSQQGPPTARPQTEPRVVEAPAERVARLNHRLQEIRRRIAEVSLAKARGAPLSAAMLLPPVGSDGVRIAGLADETVSSASGPPPALRAGRGRAGALFGREPNSSITGGGVENVQGISENSAEDLRAFRTNVVLQAGVVTFCVVFFSIGRLCLPLVYQGEAADDVVPATFFGWVCLSLSLSVDDIIYDAGLDRGMFVQFLNFAMSTLLALGLPLVLILCPLHYFYGGQAAGRDKLSQFDMANVEKGSWLCWVHAATVWYVVLTITWSVFSQKRVFADKRHTWLMELPAPRSTTVLVEDIPDGRNTDEELRRYFDEEVFGKPVVKCVYVVKDTNELLSAIQKKKNIDEMLEIARGRSRRDVVLKAIGGSEDALLAQQVEAEQQVDRLRRLVDQSEDYNTNTAFVTFLHRRDAAIVMRLFTVSDHEEVSVSLPPAPDDIIWEDLLPKGSPQVQHAREMFGNMLVFLLFILFVPTVLGIAAIARWESLHATFGNLGFGQDPFAYAQTHYPEQVALWNGLVGTLVLTGLMGFLPTFLMLIFQMFFLMKGKARMQLKVQVWYFYFLVVFVLLVTAIGSSDFGLLQTVTFLVRNPLEIFPRLAEKMPSSTHFYLEYLLVQWGAQSLNLTRYLNLIKYFALRQLYDEKTAKRLSEPEDQDFYGIGSLSARATLNLTIPLVFCTLSPFICLIGIINFFTARLAHCYLFVFAETRKPDLGGDFFYRQLLHTQEGLFLYIILMTGVLMERSSSWVPGAISASSMLYMAGAYRRFQREFILREMGLHEIEGDGTDPKLRIYVEGEPPQPPQDDQGAMMHYKQPELPPPPPVPVAVAPPTGNWLSWMGGGAFATHTAAPARAPQLPRGSVSPAASPRGGSLGRASGGRTGGGRQEHSVC